MKPLLVTRGAPAYLQIRSASAPTQSDDPAISSVLGAPSYGIHKASMRYVAPVLCGTGHLDAAAIHRLMSAMPS